MNIKEILAEFLRENGYDGLCNPDTECGCSLDDFMPCDEPSTLDCRAGYRHVDGLIYPRTE